MTYANNWYSERDDAQHTGASFVIGAASEVYFNNLLYSNASCMAVGVAKEVRDEISYGGFSNSDLGYDLVGCVSGTLLSRFVMHGLSISANDNRFSLNYQLSF
ncbi:hypothetical protein ACFODT_07745 [Vibrio zhugei]|uniref:Uncharacterized protein n=1 Tax=Vibrio zhugei TaxID=2479546 RepID=A0ABV7C973_9VIBR|nr:hypothetical protein [Vibrio zhugei]